MPEVQDELRPAEPLHGPVHHSYNLQERPTKSEKEELLTYRLPVVWPAGFKSWLFSLEKNNSAGAPS